MKQGLFKFDYIIYDGKNAPVIAKKFNLNYEEIDDEMIIDPESEVTLQKGDCLMRVPGWICVIPRVDFKKLFMGDIKG